jgi:hypothetical protein
MSCIRNAWRRLRAGRFPWLGAKLFGKKINHGCTRMDTDYFILTVRRNCFIRVNPCPSVVKMKSKKKKVALPRRTWQINPVTRVKESSKKYSRPRVKQVLKKLDE